jgi:hypothetical protein
MLILHKSLDSLEPGAMLSGVGYEIVGTSTGRESKLVPFIGILRNPNACGNLMPG